MNTTPSKHNNLNPTMNTADQYYALQLENAKMADKIESLKTKNAILSKKNKQNYLRIRLIRQHLLSLQRVTHEWSDSMDYGIVQANVNTINTVNKILSTIPTPKNRKKN